MSELQLNVSRLSTEILQNEGNFEKQNSAKNQLIALGESAIPYIVKSVIENSSSNLRTHLGNALFNILKSLTPCSPEKLNLLLPLLDHENWYVAYTGTEVLSDLGVSTPETEKVIFENTSAGENQQLFYSSIEALATFATESSFKYLKDILNQLYKSPANKRYITVQALLK